MYDNGKTISTTEFGDILLLGASEAYQQPVVVEMSVIKRLTDKLISVHFGEIKASFKAQLNNVHNIQDYVDLLEKELAFQRTVNQIREIDLEECGLKQVGKIELDEEETQAMA